MVGWVDISVAWMVESQYSRRSPRGSTDANRSTKYLNAISKIQACQVLYMALINFRLMVRLNVEVTRMRTIRIRIGGFT